MMSLEINPIIELVTIDSLIHMKICSEINLSIFHHSTLRLPRPFWERQSGNQQFPEHNEPILQCLTSHQQMSSLLELKEISMAPKNHRNNRKSELAKESQPFPRWSCQAVKNFRTWTWLKIQPWKLLTKVPLQKVMQMAFSHSWRYGKENEIKSPMTWPLFHKSGNLKFKKRIFGF